MTGVATAEVPVAAVDDGQLCDSSSGGNDAAASQRQNFSLLLHEHDIWGIFFVLG